MTSQRLLIVLPDAALGGGHFMNFRLARHLQKRGWTVAIAFLFDRGDADYYHATYPEIPQFHMRADTRLLRLGLPVRLAKIVGQYDITIAGLDLAATNYTYIAALLARRPLLVWMHIAFGQHMKSVSGIDRTLSLLVYKQIRHMVFPSQGALESLEAALGGTPTRARWQVIENFNDGNVTPPPDAPRLPSHIFSRPIVITIARLAPQKALDRLINVHANLLHRGLLHNLVILGEGPLRPALEALAEKLGVTDSLYMPGHVSNADEWLHKSTLFALCSEYEGLPLVLLEALQMGVPIVSMDCPSGPREILDGGHSGRLTPPGDLQAFEGAIAELLQSGDAREILALRGRERSAYFSVERIIPIWDELLIKLAMRDARP